MCSNTLCTVSGDHKNSVPIEQGLTLTDPRAHRRKPRTKPTNPLQAGFVDFLEQHNNPSNDKSTRPTAEDLTSKLPKRYSLYPPLLLLPANVFTATPAWRDFYAGLSPAKKQQLCGCIADAFKAQGPGVTHIAINAPIAAELETDIGKSKVGIANVIRSPAGLVPLHGDFGPRSLVARVDGEGLFEAHQPTQEDFEKAFWVSAVQNGGVVQMWAPLWTMFSRGNVKEKARILEGGTGVFEGLDDGGVNGTLDQELGDISVVDLFVGVGYFAFSYLKRGVDLVWGWDINGWSVEGFRRGCKRNGWRVKVLRVHGDGQVVDEQGREGNEALKGLAESFDMVQDKREGEERIRCVVFQGDNKWSGKVMTTLKDMSLQRRGSSVWKRVRHVNLGLLPHARDSWHNSVRILDSEIGGWLHVHENVDVRDFQSRKIEIVQEIGKLVAVDVAKLGQWETSCCHLEEVKTYAPGVMHCVFDIQVLPAR
jgi:tRNA wybutosine-synthesizing protein 2